MNPSVDRTELTLAINEVETACDVSIAMDVHKEYGLTAQQADNALEQVRTAIGSWRIEADRLQIPRAEQDLMAYAFQSEFLSQAGGQPLYSCFGRVLPMQPHAVYWAI